MRFLFPHSHDYRRGRVTVEDDRNAEPDGLVEFGEGVTVIAEAAPRRRCHSSRRPPISYRTRHACNDADVAARKRQGGALAVGAYRLIARPVRLGHLQPV